MKTVERFSPSTLEHLDICPGWIPEPYSTSNQAGDEGKLMHTALETGIYTALEEEQKACVQKVQGLFTREMVALGVTARSPLVCHREKWVGIEGFNRGIIDVLAITGEHALIGDAKFGRVEVEDAETNLQGISYAVAVFEEFPIVNHIKVIFAQPRCDLISSALFDRKVYHSLLLRLKTIRANVQQFAATQDSSRLNPRSHNCAFCGNITDCPAVGQKALAVANGYALARDEELPDLFDPAQLATPEKRAQAEKLRRVLEKWCSSVQKHNVEFRLQGTEIPGFELRSRSGEKSVTNPLAAWETAQELAQGKLTEADLASVSTISLPKLKEAVAEHAPRGYKAKLKQALENQLVDRDALSKGGEIYYLQKINT